MKDSNLPIVEAIPVSTAQDSEGVYFVDLPIGQVDLGFQVLGSPPQFSVIDPKSPLRDLTCVGHYIHGISLPQSDIINLVDPVQLMKLIQVNAATTRRLVISRHLYFVDSSLGSSAATKGPLYKHELPTTTSLGIGMRGFPPLINVVAPTSPLAGRIHAGQTVVALLVPGKPIMNLEAGAFTADRVEEQLMMSCAVVGRQLVVKDGSGPKGQVGSSRAMDDCVIS